MTKSGFWAVLPLVLMAILSGNAQATTCMQRPLAEVIEEADAIFSGQVTSVDYEDRSFSFGLCSTQSDGPRCGAKVARVTVNRVWKGDVGEETSVYSEDGCYCLGGYFDKGDQRIFMVLRDGNSRDDLGSSEFRIAFCGRNNSIQWARESGVIESLDSHFSGAR